MPEGPEVRITADGLSAHMTGAYIQGIYVNNASRYYNKPISNHDNLQYPLYVQSVATKGKKILINCVDAYQKPVIMVSALAMEGSWKLNSGKHAGIEIHLQEENGNSKTVYFHDTRHFGTFHICFVQEELNFVLKDVGPDLLSEDIPYEQYHSVISSSKLSRKEICWFLMEQKFFSGVGNYILAEVLYECGILPTRLLGNLSDQDKYNLLQEWNVSDGNNYQHRVLIIGSPLLARPKQTDHYHILDFNLGQAFEQITEIFKNDNYVNSATDLTVHLHYSTYKDSTGDALSLNADVVDQLCEEVAKSWKSKQYYAASGYKVADSNNRFLIYAPDTKFIR
jgi:formamidopyrimidine-DNA glycosylase